MGGHLTRLALIAARELNLHHAATRLLCQMATVALDTTVKGKPPDLYYAGRVDMAFGLGYGSAIDPTPAQSPAAMEAVKRASAELREHRAVLVVEQGVNGRHTTYSLAPLRAFEHLLPPRQEYGNRAPREVDDRPF